jgi:DNA invertase Pin-like site-specific DNA recombinase
MAGLTVGYARCSTDAQDLTVQREALEAMGVSPERIYVDYADLRVMPISLRRCWSAGVGSLKLSA